MRAFVIGAAGFLGSHLCRCLAEAGHAVVAFDRVPQPALEPAFASRADAWHVGDLADTDGVAAAGQGCDVAYLLAGSRSPSVDGIADLEVAVLPSLRLLRRLKGMGVGRLVFVSSGGTVYGAPERVPIPETAATEPQSAYGINKLALEKYVLMQARADGFAACILRLSNPFGPLQASLQGQGVIAAFFRAALTDGLFQMIGDGGAVRDFIFVADAVEAMGLAGTVPLPAPCVLNIGSGEGRTVAEVADTVERLIGRPVARRHLPARPTDVPAVVLDIARARAILGWEPRTPWERGMDTTFHWYRRALLG